MRTKIPSVAYFSMEFGIERLPLFAGGLGVLAGDSMKSFADLGRPVVGVGLLYNKGSFHQKLTEDGWQTEWYERFDPTGLMKYNFNNVSVPIKGKELYLNSWRFDVIGENGGRVPIYLLDTNGNNHERPWEDSICTSPYPASCSPERLSQEQVLGTGGVRTIKALGYEIDKYHFNECHPALAVLELIKIYGSMEEVKKHTVFTTHTSLPAGFDSYPRDMAEDVLGSQFPSAEYMKDLTGNYDLNMGKLTMALSPNAFAVSPLHEKVSKYLFRDFPNIENLYSIDNGVHLQTWASPEIQKLFDRLTNREWRTNPKILEEKILEVSDEEAWAVHKRSKERLGEFASRDPRVKGTAQYDPEKLTIYFGRRFTHYKQPTLIFDDPERLAQMGKDIQIFISGKAHPHDIEGKNLIKEVFRNMKELEKYVSIWFIEDYDMQVAKYVIRGSDVLLNTPMRLLEASGTSGMKAAVNFVPQLSIPDGWWIPREPPKGYKLRKGLIEGVTGWGIGRVPTEEDIILLFSERGNEIRERDRKSDAENLYDKLEHELIPLFKGDKTSWIKVGKNAAAHNSSYYNTHRVVKEYLERAYLQGEMPSEQEVFMTTT